jgi:hypothetical protein
MAAVDSNRAQNRSVPKSSPASAKIQRAAQTTRAAHVPRSGLRKVRYAKFCLGRRRLIVVGKAVAKSKNLREKNRSQCKIMVSYIAIDADENTTIPICSAGHIESRYPVPQGPPCRTAIILAVFGVPCALMLTGFVRSAIFAAKAEARRDPSSISLGAGCAEWDTYESRGRIIRGRVMPVAALSKKRIRRPLRPPDRKFFQRTSEPELNGHGNTLDGRLRVKFTGGGAPHEHPVVDPHVSHFMHVPFRTSVKLPHSEHISPS